MAGTRTVAVVKPISRIAILLQRMALEGPTTFSACAALARVRERKSAAQSFRNIVVTSIYVEIGIT